CAWMRTASRWTRWAEARLLVADCWNGSLTAAVAVSGCLHRQCRITCTAPEGFRPQYKFGGVRMGQVGHAVGAGLTLEGQAKRAFAFAALYTQHAVLQFAHTHEVARVLLGVRCGVGQCRTIHAHAPERLGARGLQD